MVVLTMEELELLFVTAFGDDVNKEVLALWSWLFQMVVSKELSCILDSNRPVRFKVFVAEKVFIKDLVASLEDERFLKRF